ncbi:MAG: helix-turn-helix transcriptional regulator [Chloroflexota bacterium]|nr:helix-turn-helix transcriptional regulator [Chloroflexota bacterium]
MVLDKILSLFPEDKGSRPNKFTLYMGDQIRNARIEAGFSQGELAEKIYMRRPTLSDIENGKSEPSASALGLLSFYLKKPLTYFFPSPLYEETVKEDMDELSLEIQMYFEQIYGDELKKLLISITKEFAEYDPEKLVVDLAPLIFARLDREKELEEYNKGNSIK